MSNPIGIHSLVWAGDVTPESVALAVSQTKKTGYDLLELSLHDSVVLDVPSARQALSDSGLQIACSRGLAFDADVSSTDSAVVSRGGELLAESLEITHALGGTVLTGVLFSGLRKYTEPLSTRARANVVSALKELASQAAQWDMIVGLEVVNRYETNVANTARAGLQLADDIGHDNVMIHLDTYHMNIEEDNLFQPVRDAGPRLGYVHIGENHRGYLGSGHVQFDVLFGALAGIGYDGPITFESFSSAVVAPALSSDLAVWRDLWSDSENLATHARAFIDDQISRAGMA